MTLVVVVVVADAAVVGVVEAVVAVAFDLRPILGAGTGGLTSVAPSPLAAAAAAVVVAVAVVVASVSSCSLVSPGKATPNFCAGPFFAMLPLRLR